MQVIRQCSVEEFFSHPDARALLTEYAAESGLAGLPAPTPHAETYEALEKSGRMQVIAAFDDDHLIGFITLLVYLNPHYSALLGVVESFFVRSEQRGRGAGMKLLRHAENSARAAQAAGILISAPSNSLLASVLAAHKTYRPTHRVFLRGLT